MTESVQVFNLSDFEQLAQKKLDAVDYDYYASGAEDEVTLNRNKQAWKKIVIWPRALVDVSNVDHKADFLGFPLDMPFMIPPMAMQRLAHPDGEIGLARAAHAAGVMYCITQQSTTTIEKICSEAPGPKLFQLYMFKDRDLSAKLIRRAEASGVKALVLTVDSPVLGRRERDLRNKFTPQSRGIEIVNWTSSTSSNSGGGSNGAGNAHSATAAHTTVTSVSASVASRVGGRDSGLTWSCLAWIKSVTDLPIILKGVVHPEDAALAVHHGCSAVWVSNHGGRQLDGAPATADALPRVAQAVQGRIPVIVDGGISRVADMMKALALGASVVCIGRPLLWALAMDGERSAKIALEMIREELRTAMALSGVPSISSLSRSLVQTEHDQPPSAKL